MPETTRRPLRALPLLVAITLSGAAGLTWELVYQHHAALALGISAYGTAVTLTAVMGGMGLGGLLASHLARTNRLHRPLRAYGVAEIAIGISSLALAPALAVLASIDGLVWAQSPALAPIVRLLGTLAVLLVPAVAMGATIPFLAPVARQVGSNVAVAYGLNTAGAVVGVLAVTFAVLPSVGVMRTSLLAASINVVVGIWAIAVSGRTVPVTASSEATPLPPAATPSSTAIATHCDGVSPGLPVRALSLAFASGFVIFALEVSWFRSIRAALQSTTEAFAIILAAFLTALALGAAFANHARRRQWNVLAWVLPASGATILAATPWIDALDLFVAPDLQDSVAPFLFSAKLGVERFAWVFAICGIPATLVGTVFPTLLARHDSTSGAGRLLAANTLGAVSGSLVAGFVLLPTLGATRTSWLAGGAILAASLLHGSGARRVGAAVLAGAAGLAIAIPWESASPRKRAQGHGWPRGGAIEFVREGPDATTTVVNVHGIRLLVIDGFVASSEHPSSRYMRWMGHLPALAAKRLDRALVICMGTGQTADALRDQGPEALDIVDLNGAIFDAAPLFASNDSVLEDVRVTAITMDGRAHLRRTKQRYDLITLEPMPPNFAGSNHLYSREFYELMRERLSPGGVAAQWLPIHLLTPAHMKAIVASFADVFPYTRLWQSPGDETGVLIGGLEPWELRASAIPLEYDSSELSRQMTLDYDDVKLLIRDAERITDDNQLLSYGLGRFDRGTESGVSWSMRLRDLNTEILRGHQR